MKKRNEVEQHIKEIIRDKLAINPIVSIRKVQTTLFDEGFRTSQDTPLDRHYVTKLVTKIQRENIATLKYQDKAARLSILIEKYRVISDQLLKVVFYDRYKVDEKVPVPSFHEQIMAANLLMRWDLALFYTENDAGLYVLKTETDNPRNKPLDPEARAKIIKAFQNWGFIKPETNESLTK